MNAENENINIDDFFKIYPPLTIKTDETINNKPFLKFFNKVVKPEKNSESPGRRSVHQRGSTRKTSSIGGDRSPKKHSSLRNIEEKEENNDIILKDDQEWYLIDKGINLQNKKRKRTNDVKTALELYLNKSNLIKKLTEFFHTHEDQLLSVPIPAMARKSLKLQIAYKNSISQEYANLTTEQKIVQKINSITAKLSDSVKIVRVPENTYIIRMYETGDNCYFLINGRLSVLKPVEYKHVKISYDDYLKYLVNLYYHDEKELVTQLLALNRNFIHIHYIEKLLDFIKSYFIIKLKTDLTEDFSNNIDLNFINERFKSFYLKYEDYGLSKNDIESRVIQLKVASNGNKNEFKKDMKNYFLTIFKPTFDDIFLLNTYSHVFDKKPNKEGASLFKYEILVVLPPGTLCGETALESASRKRNASIRTEDDCIILSLSNDVYASLLSDDNKKLKSLDVSFLCNNFFFGNISPVLFNKYYFPLFTSVVKKKDDELFKQGDELSSIFLLKEGLIKYEIVASVIDIYNIIKYYIFSIEKYNDCFKLPEKEIKNLKNMYLNDSFYANLRNKNYEFNEQLKQKNRFGLSFSNTSECIGLIEFFLETKHVTSCYVESLSAKFMEISRYSLDKILNGEKQIIQTYFQLVCSKILSHIKRFHNLKQDFIAQIEHKIYEKKVDESKHMDYFIKGQAGLSKPYKKEKMKPLMTESCNNSYKSIKLSNDKKSSRSSEKNLYKNANENTIFPDLNYKRTSTNFLDNDNIFSTNTQSNYDINFVSPYADNKKLNYSSLGKMKNLNIHKSVDEKITMPKIITHFNILKNKKDKEMSNTIVNCGKVFLSLNQIQQRMKNINDNLTQVNYNLNQEDCHKNTSPNVKKCYNYNSFSSYRGFKHDMLKMDRKKFKNDFYNLKPVNSNSKGQIIKTVNSSGSNLQKTFLIKNTGIGNKNKNKAKLIVDSLSFKNYLDNIESKSEQQNKKRNKFK